MFGVQHLSVLLFFAVFGFLLINLAKKLPKDKQVKIGHYFAISLSATVIIWMLLKVYVKQFDIREDLPFHLCNFLALLLPFFTRSRKKLFYEILLFWIIAGTSHAVITPDLKQGFPNFVFLRYWYVHAGLIIFIFYATFVYDLRPRFKSVLISFFALQGYILLMFIINRITGGNYFYTNHKPEGPTALDYLGDYPTYIFVAELIIIPYFFIIYLPFYLTRKKVIT
jgi:hypothetical integral membrane protein (TIGR02206 family)